MASGHPEPHEHNRSLKLVLRVAYVTGQDIILTIDEFLLLVICSNAAGDQRERTFRSIENRFA